MFVCEKLAAAPRARNNVLLMQPICVNIGKLQKNRFWARQRAILP